MKKFKSVRNGQVAELVSENDKQVVIRLEESGEERKISPATLKRWWKPHEEESVTKEPQTEETIQEEPAEEVNVIDIIEDEEPASKKEKKKEIDFTPHPLKNIIEKIAEEMDTIVTVATVPTFKSLKLKDGEKIGRRYAAFTFSDNNVVLWLYSPIIGELVEYRTLNHVLDARVVLTETDIDTQNLIRKLLQLSKDYVISKQTK
jgi:hypothetical protein